MPNNAVHFARWKTTHHGTPIELHASTNLEALRSLRPILLMGGVHGDEPEGVRLATETLKWLKSDSADIKQPARPRCPWVIIPCLNVDGFKNETRVNGRGVDLNRNYPAKDWSAEARAERYFPGTAPASEVEIQAVVELIRDFNPRLIIHCHSWKPCIVGAGPDAIRDTDRLAKSSGYEGRPDIGYPTPGSLSSYGYHDLKIPVICIEEDDTLTDYDTIWPRFKNGIIEVFEDLTERSR